jgi:hypothetical protein
VPTPKESDDVACVHHVPEYDGGFNGLERHVIIFQGAKNNHTATSNRPHEGDKPRDRRSDLGPGQSLNVNPAVASRPRGGGALEPANHVAHERPHPARHSIRASRRQQRDGDSEQRDEERGNPADCGHGNTVADEPERRVALADFGGKLPFALRVDSL